MILTEYNEELGKKQYIEEGRAEGFAEARAERRRTLRQADGNFAFIQGRLKDVERASSDKRFREVLLKEYRLL